MRAQSPRALFSFSLSLQVSLFSPADDDFNVVTLTDRPQSARWLTQAEKDMAVARVKSERLAQTEVLDSIHKKKVMRGMFNPITLTTAFVFCLNNIPAQGLAFLYVALNSLAIDERAFCMG